MLIQKNSKYFNRPNKGNSTLLLFVFLIDGKTEAENINGSWKEVNLSKPS